MANDVRKIARDWARHVGEREAVGRLISRGMSSRAAERICDGTYESEPKALRQVILDEMAKDGFSLAGGKAS